MQNRAQFIFYKPMFLQLYKVPKTFKTYSTPLFSVQALIALVFLVTLFLAPFGIAYASGGNTKLTSILVEAEQVFREA